MEVIRGRQGARRVKRDTAIKVCHNLYLSEEPTPHQLAEILTTQWPDCALDGYSAARHHLGKQLEFPLAVLRSGHMPASDYFTSRRVVPRGVLSFGRVNVCNPLQAVEIMEDEDAIVFLEALLASKGAEDRLRLLKKSFPYLPRRTQGLLDRIVIGADSVPERRLTRALGAYFRIRNNAKIGAYRWDLVLEEHNIAIEVDGYAYHNGENRQRFEVDRHKLNDAVHRGWRPLHYTALTIEHHLEVVVAQVRAIADGHRPQSRPPWEWHLLWRHLGPHP